jgi:transposase-like protein
MRKRYTSEQRDRLLSAVSRGGVTVAEAADGLGVAASTAYLWVRRAKDEARRSDKEAAPRFARLVSALQPDDAIAVRVGRAEIHVRRGFDDVLLRAVVAALRDGEA